MRDYLSLSGWLLSPGTTAGFPDWLEYSVYRQAVWKWIGLITLAVITILIVVSIHRLSRRRISGQSTKACLHSQALLVLADASTAGDQGHHDPVVAVAPGITLEFD